MLQIVLAVVLPSAVLAQKGRYAAAILVLLFQALSVEYVISILPFPSEYSRVEYVVAAIFVLWVTATAIAAGIGPAVAGNPARRPGAQASKANAKFAFDFCKEQYEELSSDYRYFGSLRARIAWTPVSVLFAVGVIIFTDFDPAAGVLWPPLVAETWNVGQAVGATSAAVLGMIYLADAYLAREQLLRKVMSRFSEEKWKSAAEKAGSSTPTDNDAEFYDYGALRRIASREVSLIRALDTPNGLLAAYLAALAFLGFLLISSPHSEKSCRQDLCCQVEPSDAAIPCSK